MGEMIGIESFSDDVVKSGVSLFINKQQTATSPKISQA